MNPTGIIDDSLLIIDSTNDSPFKINFPRAIRNDTVLNHEINNQYSSDRFCCLLRVYFFDVPRSSQHPNRKLKGEPPKGIEISIRGQSGEDLG